MFLVSGSREVFARYWLHKFRMFVTSLRFQRARFKSYIREDPKYVTNMMIQSSKSNQLDQLLIAHIHRPQPPNTISRMGRRKPPFDNPLQQILCKGGGHASRQQLDFLVEHKARSQLVSESWHGNLRWSEISMQDLKLKLGSSTVMLGHSIMCHSNVSEMFFIHWSSI